MTKAHYKDGLAAAWMAKYHGILFDAAVRPVFSAGGHPALQFVPEKFYIHPDSLHLLRPRIGDFVTNCDDNLARVVEGEKKLGQYEVPLASAEDFVGKEAEIIRRDGHAFHWPEWEE